ncbi:FecR family protein [Chitinophaga vietnamensis]|uniref:FecR family protein n=1 Tax=Chitinophaga vietnamensis TaxID=2593957 RepID=UPI0011786098|nr:FecR domain-containing protein [Chitinophaga vietnamensis]
MMNEERFVLLITRKMAGSAAPEELQELEALLEAHPAWKERYQHLVHYFTDQPNLAAEQTELALQRTLSRIRAQQEAGPVMKPVRNHYWRWAAAALLLLAAGGAWFFFGKAPAPGIAANVQAHHNGKATRSFMELADGSKIWLNASSTVTYPPKFKGNTREVSLEGEAFFDVASDPRRPFIIHLKNGTIKVLGTSFNIRAYDNEPVQAAVVTGKVAFISRYHQENRASDTILITPDVKVTYAYDQATLVKDHTIGAEEKAWTEGRLIFRNATLEEIGATLERSFNKHVVFDANAPREYRLTGAFHNNSLEEIMYYFSRSKAFHYHITDSTLVISE